MKYVEIPRSDNESAALLISRGFTYAYSWSGMNVDVYKAFTSQPDETKMTLDEVEDMPVMPWLSCAKIGSKHYAVYDRSDAGTLTIVNVQGGSKMLPTVLDREGANDLLAFLYDIREIIEPYVPR